jgi:hypothetical protein
MRDQVRRVLELAAKAADDVAVGLSECVGDAVVAVDREQVAELARCLQPRLGEDDLIERDGLLDLVDLEPEPLVDRLRDPLKRAPVGLLVLVAPPPVLEAAGYQWTPRIR